MCVPEGPRRISVELDAHVYSLQPRLRLSLLSNMAAVTCSFYDLPQQQEAPFGSHRYHGASKSCHEQIRQCNLKQAAAHLVERADNAIKHIQANQARDGQANGSWLLLSLVPSVLQVGYDLFCLLVDLLIRVSLQVP